MKAIMIHPALRRIELVEITNLEADVDRLIPESISVQLSPQVTMWVGSRALLEDSQAFWTFRESPDAPVAGPAILTGLEPMSGQIVDCPVPIDALVSEVQWRPDVSFGGYHAQLVLTGEPGAFQPAIQRVPIWELGDEVANPPEEQPSKECWIVYDEGPDHDPDNPDGFQFRAQQWRIQPGKPAQRLGEPIEADTIEELYEELTPQLPEGAVRLPRADGDNPSVVETWI
jgi:hypothetical protein